MPPTLRQPLVRPESAVGRCWRAAWRPAASIIHKIDALYGGSPISGADSLVICSQNRFWYPKLLTPARLGRMGVGKHILHPRRPKTASYGLTRRQKNPKTPKNAIKPFGAQWILEAAGRRAALQHRPTADSGHANGWRTIRGMWTNHIRRYITPTIALGPELPWVLT